MANSQISDKARQARLWLKELDLAGKREKTWREEAERVVKRYRGEEKKKSRFNVLWSNTETLRPAIYNSRPVPDVRRRFRDSDPLGKAVSEVLERALMVMVDYECTDQALKNDVLDGLLVGRGVSRIRYIPSLRQIGEAPQIAGGAKPLTEEDGGDAEQNTPQEEVEYEQVVPEHVDWKDLRLGYGRVWDEVPSVFFRHKLTRPDAEKQFGKEVLKQVEFTVPTEDKNSNQRGDEVNETERVSEFWEVWDKNGKRVFFIHEKVEQLIFPVDNPEGEPPIEFSSFFPIPEPLRIIENTDSLLPIIPFNLYREEADDLADISRRISKNVKDMKLRGMYDSKLGELNDLLSNEEGTLTPIQNAQAYIDGGLDKAISWFPTEKAAEIIQALYEARKQQKAVIDELVGISDILRGATDPDETATAQELKQTNASIRLQRMQKEVQRYSKDLMRLGSEAICEKFAPETLAEMTELNFPTAQEKALAQQPLQPPQPGQPAQPQNPILQMPTWEDIIGLMRSNAMRRYKIDVETDSTVASTLNSDMQGMAVVLKAIGELMQLIGPMVQSGALPVEAAKELVMAVIRRSRMGMAVEDAFDKMKPPAPPGPPKEVQVAQIKAQTDKEAITAKAQADVAKSQAEQQAQAASRQAELEMEAQKSQLDAQIELQKDAQAKQHELTLKQAEGDLRLRELSMQLENERLIADANNQTKIMVAEIAAQAQLDAAAQKAAESAQEEKGALNA